MRRELRALSAVVLILVLGLSMVACSKPEEKKDDTAVYPSKRIELVVPYAPGGITDLTARALASVLPEILGQPVVVVNKSGGARLEGGQYLATSKPDGYTIGLFPPSVGWPELHFKDHPYSSDDLIPVAQIICTRQVMFVKADSEYDSVDDIIAALEDPSAKINVGVTAQGAVPHLTSVAFGAVIGKADQIVPIPLGGDAGVAKEVLGGHVPVGVATITGVWSQIEAGTLKPLAVTGSARVEGLDDVPTFEELGYSLGIPDSENTIYVPKDTPEDVVKKLDEALATAVEHAGFTSIASKAGIPTDFYGHEDYMKTYESKKAALEEIMTKHDLIK